MSTHRRTLTIGAVLAAAALLSASLGAQLRVRTVSDDESITGLGLALCKLNTTGT